MLHEMIIKKHLFYLISIGFFICLCGLLFGNYGFNAKPRIIVETDILTTAFINDEEKANTMYTNQLILVSGIVEEINYLNQKNTIILHSNNTARVICELSDNQSHKLATLHKNQKIRIKGICKGFLKDVILLNCNLETIKTNE